MGIVAATFVPDIILGAPTAKDRRWDGKISMRRTTLEDIIIWYL